MSAEMLVTGLNALYLAPMGVVSLVGTAAQLKLIAAFVGERPRRRYDYEIEVEDA